jgi:tyrosine-protein kinase Etk/Wzc
MNQQTDETPKNLDPQPSQGDSIGLLDLLIIVAKRKKMVGIVVLAAALGSVIISLLLPNIYIGTARVLPPQQNQSSAAMLLGQLGGLAALTGSSLGMKNPADLFVGMLKSRTVADNIIARFDLKRLYRKDTLVETRDVLADKSSIVAGKDGLISIEYENEDAQLAAAIANAYVEELENLSHSLAITEAGQRRLFFEQQLKKAKDDLAESEVALKVTQEKTGLIKLDDQGRAIIEAVASIRAQIAAKEVESRAMRSFATEQNSEYVRIQQQLAALRGELAKLEKSRISGDGDILLPTGRVPEAGLEYLRKFRDVKYNETIFELLAKQFEAAKIDEAKDAGIVQVVDRAVPPDRKSKPKRAVIVILATAIAGFLAVLWAFLSEAKERANRDAAHAARWMLLRSYISLKKAK